MLQIDHVYEFLYQELFIDFEMYYPKNGVVDTTAKKSVLNFYIFNGLAQSTKKILFYDQEPLLPNISDIYLDVFNWPHGLEYSDIENMNAQNSFPFDITSKSLEIIDYFRNHLDYFFKKHRVLVTSERSTELEYFVKKYNLLELYYFYHGFAALDWYRGYYALNYNKSTKLSYEYDFVSYNRIINNDRSYRINWVSKLAELELLSKGKVSFNVTDNSFDNWRDEVADPNTKLSESAKQHAERYLTDINKLIIDSAELPGSASADIPREVDALWHIVTETVFYYNKLHLTEKIFKPIVSKQPFMLLAAPGNLEYLRSYGFKTFDGIIDESYDSILDNDSRISAVAKELYKYCNLTQNEKSDLIAAITPIVEHNFHHFYGEFKHIITRELIGNTKSLFKNIGHDDTSINYDKIYHVLTN